MNTEAFLTDNSDITPLPITALFVSAYPKL